ncbi:MAG: T9SS type A sorting domain-containing protein, partial [Bacteroidota bacterium]
SHYDVVTKDCYRSIQSIVDLNSTAEQRIDAQVTWTYNEFSDQCEARVFCNGYEIFGAGIPGQIPYSTEVTVTTQGPTCTRTVQCTFDSPIETQTETGQLVVTTNDLTCSANQTTYAIYCFGEDTGERVCGGGLKGGATNRFSSIIEREMQLRVNPNPFNSEVTLSIESTFEHQSTIEIRDVTGKVIKRMQQHLIKGNNIFIADQLAELPDGIYLLVVLSDTGVVLAQDKLLKSNWK